MQRPVERSPFEVLPPFGDIHQKVDDRYYAPTPESQPPREFFRKANKESKSENEKGEESTAFDVYTMKTALCIELRSGKIFIFMPPLSYSEHYLDLIAAIEAAARNAKIKVAIEGYEPPHDSRITKLLLSPDPASSK